MAEPPATDMRPTDGSHILLLFHHLVDDFTVWRRAFDAHEAQRQRFGAAGHQIWRFARNPDNLMVGVEFPSLDAADRFLNESGVWEVMQQAASIVPRASSFSNLSKRSDIAPDEATAPSRRTADLRFPAATAPP